ncbi:MAG: hypothetical protein JSW61_07585 [Candidatus Thorarchaeota archaeon]|nr:MAG: hypothetical protein JSW61_07585 [Candidatus Thorarchaeota archaeon]
MKKQVRVGLVLAAVGFVIILAAGSVVGFPSQSGNCASSGCHDDPSGITITTDTTVNTEPGATFELTVDVVGRSGQNSLLLKFPSNLEDNSLFTYVGLSAEGEVSDGDPADLDPDTDEVSVQYSITAPGGAGSYTLTLFAAQHTPNGNSIDILVSVVPTGPGPLITDVNRTPSIPEAEETITITANISSQYAITEATLQYSTDNGTNWANVSMFLVGDLYEAEIPGFADDTYVTYRIVAVDENGIESISEAAEYAYRVGDFPIPPQEPPPQLHYGYYLGAPAIFLAYLGTALEYYDEEKFTRLHGLMLTAAYILTSINILLLFQESPSAWTALNPMYMLDMSNILLFVHSWHIWIGILSMILGTLALITHLAGWKTCNLGLPAVLLWTILGISGIYLNIAFRM